MITFAANIPGQTQTLPLAIYAALQETGGETKAAELSLVSLTLALVGLLLSEWIGKRLNLILGRSAFPSRCRVAFRRSRWISRSRSHHMRAWRFSLGRRDPANRRSSTRRPGRGGHASTDVILSRVISDFIDAGYSCSGAEQDDLDRDT